MQKSMPLCLSAFLQLVEYICIEIKVDLWRFTNKFILGLSTITPVLKSSVQ
jgi:hypothetical protein